MTTAETKDGKKWYYKDYTLNNADDYVNFVFSIGTAATASDNQTLDVERVKKTSYFEISSTKENGKFTVTDKTAAMGIDNVQAGRNVADSAYYTLSGQQLSARPVQRGIYIHAGRKIVVR